MNYQSYLSTALKTLLLSAIVGANIGVNALTWPSKPLGVTISAEPLTMLVAVKNHKSLDKADDDANDIDGDDLPGKAILDGNRSKDSKSKDDVEDIRVNTGTATLKGRLSWREIVRD